jgi:hypothetical protein
MKKALFFLLFLFFCSSVLISQEQRTFSHKENHFESWQQIDPGDTPTNYTDEVHYVGYNNDGGGHCELRTILYWNWTYSIIPKEATVQDVTIKFRAYQGYGSDFHFSIHNIAHYYNEQNINFFQQCISTNKIYEDTLQLNSGNEVFINMTFNAQSPVGQGREVWQAVKNAVQSGNNYLTLGIKLPVSQVGTYPFELFTYDNPAQYEYVPVVDLIIHYTVVNPTVTLDQKFSTGSRVGTLKKWETSAFGNSFHPDTSFVFPLGSSQTILGDQAIYANGTTNEKYNNWNNLPDVTNHHTFIITSDNRLLQSNFAKTYSGVTIRNLYDGTAVSGGGIEFLDPWFANYADQTYGGQKRNQGMNAPFIPRTSPFNPDYNTNFNSTAYKGLFLDQLVSTGNYYSVRAPLMQDIYLSQTGKTHKFYS